MSVDADVCSLPTKAFSLRVAAQARSDSVLCIFFDMICMCIVNLYRINKVSLNQLNSCPNLLKPFKY